MPLSPDRSSSLPDEPASKGEPPSPSLPPEDRAKDRPVGDSPDGQTKPTPRASTRPSAEAKLPAWALVFRIAVAALSLIVAYLVVGYMVQTKPVATTVADPLASVLTVPVLPAQVASVPRQWQGFGTIEAIDKADVPARVGATVVQRPQGLRIGSPVRAGQILAKLDPDDFERQVEVATNTLAALHAQVAQLQAEQARLTEQRRVEAQDVEVAQRELDRIVKLNERNAANIQDVDRATRTVLAAKRLVLATDLRLDTIPTQVQRLEADTNAQEANLKRARTDLARSTIVSPIDGILSAYDVEVGENLTPGQRVARVVNPDRVEASVRLPSSARSGVAVGDRLTLTLPGRDDRAWTTKVSRISPAADAQDRTMLVLAELDQDPHADPEAVLPPGSFVQATLAESSAKALTVLPRRAISEGRVQRLAPLNDQQRQALLAPPEKPSANSRQNETPAAPGVTEAELAELSVVESQPVAVQYLFDGPIPGVDDPSQTEPWAALRPGHGLSTQTLVLLNAAQGVLDGATVRQTEPTIPPMTGALPNQGDSP